MDSTPMPLPRASTLTGIELRPAVGWYAACVGCGQNLTELFNEDTPIWPGIEGAEQDLDHIADFEVGCDCGQRWGEVYEEE